MDSAIQSNGSTVDESTISFRPHVSKNAMIRNQTERTHPARPLRNKQDPATSDGVPMRPTGFASASASPAESSTAFIILLGKGPHASVLTVMPRGPRATARVRVSWWRPALLAL